MRTLTSNCTFVYVSFHYYSSSKRHKKGAYVLCWRVFPLYLTVNILSFFRSVLFFLPPHTLLNVRISIFVVYRCCQPSADNYVSPAIKIFPFALIMIKKSTEFVYVIYVLWCGSCLQRIACTFCFFFRGYSLFCHHNIQLICRHGTRCYYTPQDSCRAQFCVYINCGSRLYLHRSTEHRYT